ncbi:hypothetical protein BKP45_15295 [Anaerobacillus alkalidiazotrophicus]|uniref:Uncharacterized protein n=1 Tax=Anaerobacillus alkalidiazotrophicus TaxID=472963 RepID=A0A1S2M2C1_9BACI|nr:hypothetical protein [Anaerobacillus alkalidiazotrophicus]OIJ18891.1 hypothetical protein BKP45_15295 [Anaerobacillus alkalidiazotrophicus]
MKNKFIIIIILLLILSSCSYKSNEETSNEALLNDIFRNTYSISLFSFGQIVQKLSNVKNSDDIYIVKGMIELYNTQNLRAIPLLLINNLVNVGLYDNTFEIELGLLYQEKIEFLNLINKLLNSNDNINFLDKYQLEIKKIYEAERNLNDNRFTKFKTNPEIYYDYINELKKLHLMLQNLNEHLLKLIYSDTELP